MSTFRNVVNDRSFNEIVAVNKSGIETVALGQ
jgi:hypothetical protein